MFLSKIYLRQIENYQLIFEIMQADREKISSLHHNSQITFDEDNETYFLRVNENDILVNLDEFNRFGYVTIFNVWLTVKDNHIYIYSCGDEIIVLVDKLLCISYENNQLKFLFINENDYERIKINNKQLSTDYNHINKRQIYYLTVHENNIKQNDIDLFIDYRELCIKDVCLIIKDNRIHIVKYEVYRF